LLCKAAQKDGGRETLHFGKEGIGRTVIKVEVERDLNVLGRGVAAKKK